MLASLDLPSLLRLEFEIVLVDSASSDDTLATMHDFARSAPCPVVVERAERAGLSHARNVGIGAASGAKLLFTDDDCYFDGGYLETFAAQFDGAEFQFGGGDIYLFDPQDAKLGCVVRPRKAIIPRGSLITSGTIQGANMFFLKLVFDRLGGFREDLGAGTPFPCEDVEMCTRASLAGFVGAVLPDLKVLHHHGRRSGTLEVARQIESYDRGRGAYYALLLSRGVREAWRLWAEQTAALDADIYGLRCHEREFRAAADFLAGEIAARTAAAAVKVPARVPSD